MIHRLAPWCLGAVAVGGCLSIGFDRTAVGVGAMLLVALLADAARRARLGAAGLGGGDGARLGAVALWTTVVAGTLAGLATAAALAVSAGLIGNVTEVLRPLHHASAQRESHVAGSWAMLVELLVAMAVATRVLAGRALRAPRRLPGATTHADLLRAVATCAEHGRDSLSPFVARPDKSFAFAAGGVVAYRLLGDVAVVSGDPVGPAGTAPTLIAHLRERAHAAGARIAIYGAAEESVGGYRALGLRALCVGEEAIVDPASFTLEGRAVRKLRQSVHRVRRRGWTIEAREGRAIGPALEAEIDAVEARWRAGRGRLLGFAMSMGAYDPGVRPADVYLLARSPEGELRGVMRFFAHCGNLSLDTMRRVGETPNGLNEALVCDALAYARDRGVEEVSLNYAGLGHLVRTGPRGNPVRAALHRVAIALLHRRFQMGSLVQFCEKFSPRWRRRYLVYESRAGLARTVLRVLQAEGHLPSPDRDRAAGSRPLAQPVARGLERRRR